MTTTAESPTPHSAPEDAPGHTHVPPPAFPLPGARSIFLSHTFRASMLGLILLSAIWGKKLSAKGRAAQAEQLRAQAKEEGFEQQQQQLLLSRQYMAHMAAAMRQRLRSGSDLQTASMAAGYAASLSELKERGNKNEWEGTGQGRKRESTPTAKNATAQNGTGKNVEAAGGTSMLQNRPGDHIQAKSPSMILLSRSSKHSLDLFLLCATLGIALFWCALVRTLRWTRRWVEGLGGRSLEASSLKSTDSWGSLGAVAGEECKPLTASEEKE